MNPTSTPARKRHRIHAAGVALVTLFSAGVAWSQSTPVAPNNPTLGDFMPKEGDMSLWVLRAIFGDWNGAAQIPMLGAAMQQLNVFALAFGTLMFTWVSIIGTLNSAQDGEVLGRKWSSTWVPLRFIFGTAMMVPLTTGYSTAQHVILWLAMAGSGGGSVVWGAAMDGFVGSQATTVLQSPEYQRRLEPLIKDMLRAEICMAVMTEHEARSYGISRRPVNDPVTRTYSNRIEYGLPQGQGTETSLCGVVTSLQAKGEVGSGGKLGLYNKGGSVGNAVAGTPAQDPARSFEAVRRLVDAQTQALIDVSQGPLRAAAVRIAAKTSGTTEAPQLSDAQYQQILREAIRTSVQMIVGRTGGEMAAASASFQQGMTKFIEESRTAGWMMAGPSFFQMATIRSQAKDVLNAVPEFSPGALFSKENVTDLVRKEMISDLDALYGRIEDGFQGDTRDLWNPGDELVKGIGKVIAFDPENNDHALVQIKEKGDWMMITGQGVAVVAYAASKLSSVSGVGEVLGKGAALAGGFIGGAIGEIAKGILPVTYAIAGVLFFAGITMSLILPTLPFLLSTGAVLGWLMAVFSAVVAAPIWLAGHLNPDGDGFAGQRAAGGYMILLETATRPIFIVMGLIGAFLILDPMCKFTAIAFSATLSSVQANSITGLASIAVLVCLYVVMIWTVVRTALTLTYDLAQKVYMWIGGQFAGYEKAQEFGQGAQQANAAATKSLVEVKSGLTASMLRSNGASGSAAAMAKVIQGEKGDKGDQGARGDPGFRL